MTACCWLENPFTMEATGVPKHIGLVAGLQQRRTYQMPQGNLHTEVDQNRRPSHSTWGGSFGIKHLSDAEWEEHELRQKAKFDQR